MPSQCSLGDETVKRFDRHIANARNVRGFEMAGNTIVASGEYPTITTFPAIARESGQAVMTEGNLVYGFHGSPTDFR